MAPCIFRCPICLTLTICLDTPCMFGCPHVLRCCHMFGCPHMDALCMFGCLLYVWMPPICLDAPCMFGYLPCMFGCPHIFGPLYVWVPPVCLVTPHMFECPHQFSFVAPNCGHSCTANFKISEKSSILKMVYNTTKYKYDTDRFGMPLQS